MNSGDTMGRLTRMRGGPVSPTESTVGSASLEKINTNKIFNDSKPNYDPVATPVDSAPPDLICFSHLRWDFVYQRPQHLLSRFATDRRVFYVEEPIFTSSEPKLEFTRRD